MVLGALLLLGGVEVEFFFDGFAGGGGEVLSHELGFYPASVGADEGGDDVAMGVTGVLVAVDEIGLFLEAEALHVAVSDGGHGVVGEVVGGVEVDGDVQRVDLAAGVEVVEALEALEFFVVGEAVFFTQKVFGFEEGGFVLCHFFFVIGEDPAEGGGGVYSCDHSW